MNSYSLIVYIKNLSSFYFLSFPFFQLLWDAGGIQFKVLGFFQSMLYQTGLLLFSLLFLVFLWLMPAASFCLLNSQCSGAWTKKRYTCFWQLENTGLCAHSRSLTSYECCHQDRFIFVTNQCLFFFLFFALAISLLQAYQYFLYSHLAFRLQGSILALHYGFSYSTYIYYVPLLHPATSCNSSH